MKDTTPASFRIVIYLLISTSLWLGSCATPDQGNPVEGTWQLVTGTLIEKGDTTVTRYSGALSFIKVINKSHFAFLLHDVNKGTDSTAAFSSGGGRYTLTGDQYTEHLEYCSDRQWEGNDFSFTVHVEGDTLVQRGVEKVEGAGVERLNIEKYVRVKN